jgi:tetratricopeptide (TPR) repeat protein
MIQDNKNNDEKNLPADAMSGYVHHSRRFSLLSALIILLVSFAVYFNALFNEFVYDDLLNVVQNPWIKDLKNIPQIFTTYFSAFDPNTAASYYRPLIHIIDMFTYAVFGLNPLGFHLVNIIFHAFTSILVFSIAKKMLSKSQPSIYTQVFSPAFFIALLFSVHPIHTEAVTWISGITDLSYTFFLLLSLYLYMRSETGGRVNYYLSLMSFFLSTLCKEPALTLPFILIVYDYSFNKMDFRQTRRIVRYFPYIVVMAIYFVLRLNALGRFAQGYSSIDLNTYQYIINLIVLFSQYIQKLILPFNLSAIYSLHPLTSILQPKSMLSLVFSLGILVFAYRIRRDKILFFSLCLVVIPLLPTFFLAQIAGKSVFAERYLYLPSSGFVILLVLLLARIRVPVHFQHTILAGVLLILTLSYATGTVIRNMVWKNNYTLWSDAVKKDPDSAIAHSYLGRTLYADGKIKEAIDQYQQALNLNPKDEDIYVNLGAAYLLDGRIKEAFMQFQAVLRINPTIPEAHINLANIYINDGLIDEAIVHYQIALKLNPSLAPAYNGLGIAYIKKRMIVEAIENFSSAVRSDSNNSDYYDNLMKAYEIRKKPN